jgi:xylose isomerase
MKEDGVIENILNERYGSFNSGIGKQIDDGKATIEEMEDYVIDKPQKDLLAATHSGHLEQIKDTINHYMIEVLAK